VGQRDKQELGYSLEFEAGSAVAPGGSSCFLLPQEIGGVTTYLPRGRYLPPRYQQKIQQQIAGKATGEGGGLIDVRSAVIVTNSARDEITNGRRAETWLEVKKKRKRKKK
jgi:hypothetical protein